MKWSVCVDTQEESILARLQREAPVRVALALAGGGAVPPATSAAAAAAGRLASLFAALQGRSRLALVSAAARPFGLRDSVLPSRLMQV